MVGPHTVPDKVTDSAVLQLVPAAVLATLPESEYLKCAFVRA